jgi:hypothetical protein
VSENVQFAKMFGFEQIDPFLVEIFGDCFTETLAVPTKETAEAGTQMNGAPAAPHPWAPAQIPPEPPCLMTTAAGQYFAFPNQTPPQFVSAGQPMLSAPFFDNDFGSGGSFRLL